MHIYTYMHIYIYIHIYIHAYIYIYTLRMEWFLLPFIFGIAKACFLMLKLCNFDDLELVLTYFNKLFDWF